MVLLTNNFAQAGIHRETIAKDKLTFLVTTSIPLAD